MENFIILFLIHVWHNGSCGNYQKAEPHIESALYDNAWPTKKENRVTDMNHDSLKAKQS